MNWHALVGITAGIIQVISIIPYIKSMVHGSTRPNIVSNCVWALLSVIALVAQFQAGASWSVIILIAITFNICLIVLLCLVGYGYKKYYTLDWVCLCLALVAIVLWQLTSNPLLAISIAVCANMLSTLPTIVKTYREPHTELPVAWLLLIIASGLSIASTTIWNPENLLYPTYFLLESTIIAGLAFFGQKRISKNIL